MNKIVRHTLVAVSLAAATLCAALPAAAAKPEWAGNPHGEQGKGNKGDEGHKDKGGKESKGAAPVTIGGYFGEHQRTEVRTYYQAEHHGKGCPPGLAKKNNGCLPPGQARKWAVGQPLPHEVVYYPVPSSLVVRIGTPPPGYQYVRVASDILLIAVGTKMVIDGMQDLVR
jgi:Ni/Co efflux regulator RcnB